MIADFKNPYAIVIGLDSVQGLQTARILANNKIPVIGFVKDPKHYSRLTNCCREIKTINTASDDIIETLQAMGTEFKQKPVLFPCEDVNVLILAKHQEELKKYYSIVLPDYNLIKTLIDKTLFYQYAEQHGFTIPKTVYINSTTDAKREASELHFPCILKPSFKGNKWNEKTTIKAFKVDNLDEFYDVYRDHVSYTDSFILQEYIEGNDLNHFTCNCYFGKHNTSLVTFISQKLRQWPPETGQACLGIESKNVAVLNQTIEFFQKVDFRGLGYLELKWDSKKNKYYMIEANVGRPTGRSALAEASGVSFLYTMYCDAVGRELPKNRSQLYKNTKWIHLRHYFQSALNLLRNGQFNFQEFLQDLKGQKVFALFSFNDPLPFLGDLGRGLRLLLSRKERQKRII